jgi:hypothetical protein
MKSYSNDTVTATDIEIAKREAQAHASIMMEAVDIKQGKQINFLRWALAASFLANAALTLCLKYLA